MFNVLHKIFNFIRIIVSCIVTKIKFYNEMFLENEILHIEIGKMIDEITFRGNRCIDWNILEL